MVRRFLTQVGGAKNDPPPVKIYLNAFHRVVHNSIDLSFFAHGPREGARREGVQDQWRA